MIHIPDKYHRVLVSIPKNEERSGSFDFLLHSEMTYKDYEYEVTDEGTSANYYQFYLEFSDVEDGEYRYFLSQDGTLAAEGLAQIGDIADNNPIYVFYNSYSGSENIQYYPNTKPFIRLTTEEHLTEEASAITYSVLSSTAWTLTAYIRHHTQSEWSQMLQEEHTEKNYQGTIVIGTQVEDYPKHFKIVVATNDGQASAEQEITQDAHYYFSVDVYSPSSAISASATELSYGIQYSEFNSIHTGTFYIYKDDVLVREQPFGVYPYGFSTYMEIPANTSSEPVVYKITGTLDNEQTDTFEVTQAAAEPEPTDYSKMRFSVEMLEDGDINWEGRGYEYYDIIRNGVRDEGNQLYHSIDGLLAGDVVEFYVRADNLNPYFTIYFSSTARHNVFGNIMSIVYADFDGITTLPKPLMFSGFFKGDTNLVSAENLVLPATTLTNNCYSGMFRGCTSLTTAPVLPATSLEEACYNQMYRGCTSLNYIKCLATDISAHICVGLWTWDVSATGTFVKSESMNDWTIGNDGIPSGWTIVNYPDAQ